MAGEECWWKGLRKLREYMIKYLRVNYIIFKLGWDLYVTSILSIVETLQCLDFHG
jgi:hypothetical protein